MYERLYKDVEAVEGSTMFENWFRIDARPFKQALLNIIRHWSLMFKQHLIDHITNRSVYSLMLVVAACILTRRCHKVYDTKAMAFDHVEACRHITWHLSHCVMPLGRLASLVDLHFIASII
jgi:hypothetical protein